MDYTSFWVVVLLFVVAVIVIKNVRIIQQNTVFVIEYLGKFKRIMAAGINFKLPLVERVAAKISLRQQNFSINGKYPSKDKVIVDVSTNLIYAVDPSLEGIQRFTYVLQNREQSIGAIIENSLRTYIAKETHEGILEKKEELALHIKTDLDKQLEEWGIIIKSFQIVNVNFPPTITQAMSEVVASEQLRKAAENKGEAVKIQAVKEAEADKIRKQLEGEGIALEREAIARGLKESFEIMKSATHQESKEIMAILTLTQYLDTLKNIGMTNNSKVIFMDTQIGKSSDLMKQLIATYEVKDQK